MKVLLIGVPGFHTQDEPLFPLGLGYLISSLKKNGHDARGVYFIRENHMVEALPGFIRGFAPDLVGINCNTFNRGNVRKISLMIRALNPNIKIVVGGVHATYLDWQVLEYADFVIRGEGEIALVELCKTLEYGEKNFEFIGGLSYANKEGWLCRCEDRAPIEDLDSLPTPDFSFAEDLIVSGGMGYTIMTRGCPARCKFCSSGSFWGQKTRKHSISRAVDDIEDQISKFGINRFHFHDNTFNINVERVLSVCKEISRRGLKITWGVSCRVTPVTLEMIEAMVESGCRHIAWGVESGSPGIMNWMNKRITKEQIQYAYSLCEPYSRKGLLSTGTFMMVGFPGETKKTVQESIDLLNTLTMTDRPSCSVLYVLPGTKVWEEQTVINEDYWADTDEVLYSAKVIGVDMVQLNEWGKAIEAAGKRIEFKEKKFWDGVIGGKIKEPKCPVYK